LNQNSTETEVDVIKDNESIENLLKGFWERVQTLGEMVKQLRRDNNTLRNQIEQLESETAELRAKIHDKDLEYRRLRTEYSQIKSSQSAEFMSQQEREEIKNKIRELISKINSHL